MAEKRITIYESSGTRWLGPANNTDLTGNLDRYAILIMDALAGLASDLADNHYQALTREDWNYLADCLNNFSFAGLASNPATLIALQAHDAHRLNALGKKWFGDESAERVPFLVARLNNLQPIHAWAIIEACEWFWRHPEIDAAVDEWWSPGFRKGGEK